MEVAERVAKEEQEVTAISLLLRSMTTESNVLIVAGNLLNKLLKGTCLTVKTRPKKVQ